MTFDPTQPYMNIDGENVNLTPEQITALAAQQASYVPPTPIPDLATQLAAALINANVIPASAINSTTLATVNTTLVAAGQATISTTVAATTTATP